MNAKEFYEFFKESLNDLGVGFHGMDKVEIKGAIEVFNPEEPGKSVLVSSSRSIQIVETIKLG